MNCEAGFLVRTDTNGDQRQMGLGLTMPRDSGEAGSVGGAAGKGILQGNTELWACQGARW